MAAGFAGALGGGVTVVAADFSDGCSGLDPGGASGAVFCAGATGVFGSLSSSVDSSARTSSGSSLKPMTFSISLPDSDTSSYNEIQRRRIPRRQQERLVEAALLHPLGRVRDALQALLPSSQTDERGERDVRYAQDCVIHRQAGRHLQQIRHDFLLVLHARDTGACVASYSQVLHHCDTKVPAACHSRLALRATSPFSASIFSLQLRTSSVKSCKCASAARSVASRHTCSSRL